MIAPLERSGDLLVVSLESHPRGSRHLFAHERAGRADQGVAATDMAFQERERQARIDRFHPEAHLAQLDGQRIHVDAVDAPPNDVAERVLVVIRRGRTCRPDARDVIGEPARSSEQKVPRAASRVDDRQLKESIGGTIGNERSLHA